MGHSYVESPGAVLSVQQSRDDGEPLLLLHGGPGVPDYMQTSTAFGPSWALIPGTCWGTPGAAFSLRRTFRPTHGGSRAWSFPARRSVWAATGNEPSGNPSVSNTCLLYTSPSPRDGLLSRMTSS